MAENKKSFILYADLIHVVKKLVEQDRANNTNHAGELFLHALEYVNDSNPIPINFIVDMAFEPIKQQLKRDLRKYENKMVQWSEAGKKSAESRKTRSTKSNDRSTTVDYRSTDSTVSVNGTVNGTEEEIQKYNKFNDWILQNASSVSKMKEPFTIKEFLKIKSAFSIEQIQKQLLAMHNWKELLKKRTSANLTFRTFARKDSMNGKSEINSTHLTKLKYENGNP